MGTKSFATTFQSVDVTTAKNFINDLNSDPEITLGDESMYGDPFGEFVYNLLEDQGHNVDSASDGYMEELEVDDQGKISGSYDVMFDDQSNINIDFKGFVASKENYNFIVVTDVNWN